MDYEKAIGKPHSLWVGFAKFYADHNGQCDCVPNLGLCVGLATRQPYPNQSTPNAITLTLTNQLPTRTDLGNAEVVFENATKEEFRFVDDVAQVGAACIVVPCGDAMWASEQI